VFLLNAASVLGLLVVAFRWQPEQRESELPPEQVDEGLRAGIRYVLHAPALQAVLVRTGVFVVSGIAPVALLPVLTREELGLGPLGYGTLLGCFGAGAVLSTVSLPRVRKRVPIELLIAAATLVFAAMMVTLAHVRVVPVVGAALVVAGACWLVLMSTFNVGAQKAATAWVRGRALATFLLVFFGGMALGSAFWGEVATRLGISAALQAAALGLVVGLAAAARYRLTPVERLDVRPAEEPAELPSAQGPASAVPADPVLDLGPVLVQIEYRIEPTRAREFARAMQPVQLERRRNGATQWGLFSDPGAPGRYLESFLVESGAEYLRRRERVTVSDQAAEERALAFHIGDEPPITTHLVAEPAPE
jgi:hypothetical protein